MKIARAKSKPSRAGGKENQNSIFAKSVAILHNVMDTRIFILSKGKIITVLFNIVKYLKKYILLLFLKQNKK